MKKKKRAILYFEVDHDEKAMIEDRARRRGWPTSRYVRMLVNEALGREDDECVIGEDRQRV